MAHDAETKDQASEVGTKLGREGGIKKKKKKKKEAVYLIVIT